MPRSEPICGPEGTLWINNTGRAHYQFVCTLTDTCGACLQYANQIQIGPWPLPLHRECRCKQKRIEPGQHAPYRFVDFRKILNEMSPDAQAKTLAPGVYALLKSGMIEWKHAVTRYSLVGLSGIVAWKQLTVDQMVALGVDSDITVAAYEAVHTPEQDAIRRARAESLQALDVAGIPREAVAEEVARALLQGGPLNVNETGERLLKARDERASKQ
jgi:hypothetical protein